MNRNYELTIAKRFSDIELLLDDLNGSVQIGARYSFCDDGGEQMTATGGEVWVVTLDADCGDVFDIGVYLTLEGARLADVQGEAPGQVGTLHIGRYVIPIYDGHTAAESWNIFCRGRWVVPDPVDEELCPV